jgi:AraC-like DNA-binding protein
MYALTETTHGPHDRLAFHRHESAYIALPLEGTYEESSADGRFTCAPGTAVIHGEWHMHANRFTAAGGRVLNIELPAGLAPPGGSAAVTVDVVEIEKLARQEPARAAGAVLETRAGTGDGARIASDPVSAFLRSVRHRPTARIADLAAELGVSREHLARLVKAELGIGPTRLRSEWRFRLAAGLLARGEPLARVAAEAGYSDQSHMTRDIKSRLGRTPGRLGRFSRPRRPGT